MLLLTKVLFAAASLFVGKYIAEYTPAQSCYAEWKMKDVLSCLKYE